jgi:hypothetical protein
MLRWKKTQSTPEISFEFIEIREKPMPGEVKKDFPPIPSDLKATGELEDFLRELNKAVRASEFYPAQHPSLKTVLSRVGKLFEIAATSTSKIDLSISSEGFKWRQKPLAERTHSLRSLANRLFLRRISRIRFSSNVSLEEFRALLVALTTSPEDLLRMGGIDKFLEKEKVQNIEVDEIHFEVIPEKLDEKPVELELTELGREEAPEEAPLELTKELSTEEEQVLELLDQLEREEEDKSFLELLKEIVELVGGLTEKNRFDVHCPTFRTLLRLHRAMGCSPAQKRYCLDALRSLGNSKALDYLLSCLGPDESLPRNELRELILTIGEAAINPLFLAILKQRNPGHQRYLIDLLHQFGKTAASRLELMLTDQNPSVVRMVAALLGEIGAESSIGPLGEILYHENSGVKKEGVRALARLRTKESLDLLFSALLQTDPETRIHIASTLGDIKEKAAVPVLMKLVKRWGLSSQTFSLKKEAIDSLGKIGTSEASPLLAKLLKRRVVFARGKMNELRISAALTLGMIGGEIAFAGLERGTRGKHEGLRKACWQGIDLINDRFE